jgi:methyl-accepting chemotaxis protein
MFHQQTSLQTKLIAMTAGTLIAIFSLLTLVIFHNRDELLEDRREKIQSLVEAAYNQIEYYGNLAKTGALPETEAKKLAMDSLRNSRYSGNEYFWINDYQPRMVMHPIKPELMDKDLSTIKDAAGKHVYLEFNKVAKRDGAGFVDYQWSKPGQNSPTPKISYVKGYNPWGWVIGTGLYLEDIETKFHQRALTLGLWGLLISGFFGGSLFFLSKNIIRTLGCEPSEASEITQQIASGNLATPIECKPGDKHSLLANIQTMQNTLRNMISQIKQNAEQVASAAQQLMNSSKEVTSHSQRQSEAASSMAASVEEMAVSIDQVKENAREAYNISQTSGNNSENGAAIIHKAANEMSNISQTVQASSLIVEDLGQQSDHITSIVNTIKEIADQTNLLALNAAIEAARAGEQGRGFAVVADEVRSLADRTAHSTTEIAEMVSKIQTGTREAVGSMQASMIKVEQGVELANQAGHSINEIRDGAQRVSSVVSGISSAISEQSQASNDIASKLETIAQMSEESAAAAEQSFEAAKQLQGLSASLHQTVAQFRT